MRIARRQGFERGGDTAQGCACLWPIMWPPRTARGPESPSREHSRSWNPEQQVRGLVWRLRTSSVQRRRASQSLARKRTAWPPPLRKGPPAPTPSFLSSPQRDNKRLPVPPSGRGPRPPGRSQEPGQTPAAVAGDPAGRPRPARGELLGRYLGSVPSAASVSGPPREDGTSFREDEPDSPQPLPGKKSTCDAGHEAGAAQRPAQPETDSQRKQQPDSAGEERGQVLNTVPASEISRVSKR